MNEKLNGKPIEMPARGRPRKKETGLEHGSYGNDYESQKPLYNRHNFSQFMNNSNETNAIIEYMEGSSDKDTNGLNNMYPYKNDQRGHDMFQPGAYQQFMGPNMRQDEPRQNKKHEMRLDEFMRKNPAKSRNIDKESMKDIMLEEFNKVGETLFANPPSSTLSDDPIQVSPKEVQNGKSGGKYSSSTSEERRNSSSEREKKLPIHPVPNSGTFTQFTANDIFSLNCANSYENNLDIGGMRIDDRQQSYPNYSSREAEYGNPNNGPPNVMDNYASSQGMYEEHLSDRQSNEHSRGYESRNGLYSRQIPSRQLYNDKQQRMHFADVQEGGGRYGQYHQPPPNYDNGKRHNINSSQYPMEGYPVNRHPQQQPPPSHLHGHPYNSQQWLPSFPPLENQGQPQYINVRQQREEQAQPVAPDQMHPNAFMASVYPEGIALVGTSPWYNRKKRKGNPLVWQYAKNSHDPNQNVMHPSKYSSLDYIQGIDSNPNKMYPHPPKRVPNEREPNNTVLPLFLSSNKELTDEYREVVCSFKRRMKELDFTNVTVQQLKIFMREFGLNHTGKKNELIDRLKSTLHKIDNRCSGKKLTDTLKKPPGSKDDEYGYYFF